MAKQVAPPEAVRFDTAVEIEYPVRVRVLTRFLFAIVALQLAFGLQIVTARAAYAPSVAPGAAETCAMHHTAPKPPDKHDCCKFSGNHCQCTSLALTYEALAATAAPELPPVLTAIIAAPANAPPDSRFRPPIDS